MKGSVRKRGTTWSYRIDFGKSTDGKRNQIEKGGYKTKKEADKALNDVLFQYNNTGDYVENQKIVFQDVYNEFMQTEAKATRAYATLKRYDSLYRNHFQKPFDRFYMYQISANMINDFISEKLKNYSEEYTKGLYKTLRVIFCFAHNRKYLKKNPFDDVTPPPDPRHIGDIRHYEPEEIALMGERLKDTNVKLSFYIALNTGLRESEVFGLQWSDIDFENKKIKVHKQLLFQDRKWCFCPLKTRNAYPINRENTTPSSSASKGVDTIRWIEKRQTYERLIKQNIDYDIISEQYNKSWLNEIVAIMVDVVCSDEQTIRINKQEYPHEVVKSRFLKINSSHNLYIYCGGKPNFIRRLYCRL